MLSHGVGMLLVGAVAGYWVLERAETHKGQLRQIGRLLGGAIIIMSLVGVVCRVWCLASEAGHCWMGGKKSGYCPFTMPKDGRALAPAQELPQEGR